MNKINHIFIFCDNHDEVAQEFIDFGFIEGSSRVHENQGTRNRKFYFDNFFLEIIWVHNVDEVTNRITSPTKLYERSKYSKNGNSPFGLCLNYAEEDNTLFTNTIIYKPTYLPKNMLIEVLTNEKVPSLPWTFRWYSGQIDKQIDEEETTEKTLTKVCFGINKKDIESHYIKHLQSNDILFEVSDNVTLSLEFNHAREKRSYAFLTLPLSIEY